MNALLFSVKADKSFLHYLDFVDIVNFSHSHKASLVILRDNTLLRSLVYARCDVANITPNLDISKVMLDLYYQFRNLVIEHYSKTIPSYVNIEQFINSMIRDLYLTFVNDYRATYRHIIKNIAKSNFTMLISNKDFLIPFTSDKFYFDRGFEDLSDVEIKIDISFTYPYFDQIMNASILRLDRRLGQLLLV